MFKLCFCVFCIIMSQSKSVRLDKEVIDTLAEKRVGFETPNECLKRLLDQKSCSDNNQTNQEMKDNNES